MEIQSSRERVLRWIARKIAIDGENAVWVTTMPTLITKVSLSFPAKVWWAVVRAQLIPTANDNTLSSSLASLVACLMVGYPVSVGWIVTTEMRDRALNERAGFPSPCLIGKLCQQVNIPPNRLVDRWGETFRLTQVSKIKDVTNHLFGVKSGAVGTLAVFPNVPIDIPQAVRGPEQGESSQPSTEAPSPSASASQAPDNEEFKAQLTEMRTQVAKLAEKTLHVPTLVMRESFIPLLNQAPSTQSLDEFWGKLPKSKSGKKKHKARESDEEIPADLSRKGRRQEKKTRKASRKAARKKEVLEQQQ
uniref:Putative plant transposon protein domain-containing protein n=1 Tax=Solanum tuberosum TaxID=4113 RepID=M1DWZ4_SOLTU